MDYMASFVEKIVIERNKKVDNAILGEIQQIAVENGVETKIVMNEKAVAEALRNYRDGYAAIKAETAREIFFELDGITDLFAKGLIEELEFYDMLAALKKKHLGTE